MGFQENFLGTQKRVRNSHGKRAIGVRDWGFTVPLSRVLLKPSGLQEISARFQSSRTRWSPVSFPADRCKSVPLSQFFFVCWLLQQCCCVLSLFISHLFSFRYFWKDGLRYCDTSRVTSSIYVFDNTVNPRYNVNICSQRYCR